MEPIKEIKPEHIRRINELAQKKRTDEGLTEEERKEQAELRAAYVAAFRQSLQSQLDNTTVLHPDGRRTKLTQKTPERH